MHLLEIDATQQQRQLLVIEHDLRYRCVRRRPAQPPPLHTLRGHPQPRTIEGDQLQTIPARFDEQIIMAAFWIARETVANQSVETIKSVAHVRRAGGNINRHRRSKPEHSLHHVQYCQQTFQCSRVKSTTNFDSTFAAQLNYQKAYLQLRSETFSTLNHPMFKAPNVSSATASNFGYITAAVAGNNGSTNRAVQLGGRIVF